MNFVAVLAGFSIAVIAILSTRLDDDSSRRATVNTMDVSPRWKPDLCLAVDCDGSYILEVKGDRQYIWQVVDDGMLAGSWQKRESDVHTFLVEREKTGLFRKGCGMWNLLNNRWQNEFKGRTE